MISGNIRFVKEITPNLNLYTLDEERMIEVKNDKAVPVRSHWLVYEVLLSESKVYDNYSHSQFLIESIISCSSIEFTLQSVKNYIKNVLLGKLDLEFPKSSKTISCESDIDDIPMNLQTRDYLMNLMKPLFKSDVFYRLLICGIPLETLNRCVDLNALMEIWCSSPHSFSIFDEDCFNFDTLKLYHDFRTRQVIYDGSELFIRPVHWIKEIDNQEERENLFSIFDQYFHLEYMFHLHGEHIQKKTFNFEENEISRELFINVGDDNLMLKRVGESVFDKKECTLCNVSGYTQEEFGNVLTDLSSFDLIITINDDWKRFIENQISGICVKSVKNIGSDKGENCAIIPAHKFSSILLSTISKNFKKLHLYGNVYEYPALPRDGGGELFFHLFKELNVQRNYSLAKSLQTRVISNFSVFSLSSTQNNHKKAITEVLTSLVKNDKFTSDTTLRFCSDDSDVSRFFELIFNRNFREFQQGDYVYLLEKNKYCYIKNIFYEKNSKLFKSKRSLRNPAACNFTDDKSLCYFKKTSISHARILNIRKYSGAPTKNVLFIVGPTTTRRDIIAASKMATEKFRIYFQPKSTTNIKDDQSRKSDLLTLL